ncbi:MAG: 1,4-dihydroxy-2-naphthoate polyprenyltransferase [Phycisphaerae bacterium]|nr:1,4-dihydroxy-2-naphthoate polyprenyltransferase [Phycisphaerae bacterium]
MTERAPLAPAHAAAVWWLAIRPKTLGAAVAPVLMGIAMAWRDGLAHAGAAAAALAGALLLQIAANFANDYFDWKKGADGAERVGPVRVVSAGYVRPATMKLAIGITLLAVMPIAAYLVWRAGMAFLWIGAAGAAFALLYTGGPKPLAYIGLGDVSVFAFFGPVALAGTYAAQALQFAWPPMIAGIGPGCLAMALLAVNNLRDRHGDALVHKRTLAVRFGATFARWEIIGSIMAAAAIPIVLAIQTRHWGAIAASAVCLTMIRPVRMILAGGQGHTLNKVLAATGRCILLYGLAFAIGWILL